MPNEGHGSVKKHSLVRKSEFKTSCGTKRKALSGTNSSVPVDVEKLVHKSEKGAWIPIYGDTTDENVNQPLEKCDSSKKQFSEEDVKELLRVFLKEFRDDVSHKNDTQQEKEIAIMRTRKTQKTTKDEPPVAKISYPFFCNIRAASSISTFCFGVPVESRIFFFGMR